jgi:uncharacterized membrane protein
MTLPELESYPVHWNARGEADGFSSKAGVAFVLSLMPITALFTHALMWGLTKVEAVKESLSANETVYLITWNACLWLYLIINIIIAAIYSSLVSGGSPSVDADVLLKFLPVGTGLFFIIIGNVLGKSKQNKFVGVKTPWTFKSKQTWDATHRMTAWLWVLGGAAMMLVPFVFSAKIGIAIFVALVMIISFAPIVYSYLYYRSASDKPD